VSKQDPKKKDLDKRVRSLTTLTKENEIPALTADFLTPLTLCLRYVLYNSKVLTSIFCVLFECCFSDAFLCMFFLQDHQSLASHPPLPEEGPIQADPTSAASEAPEADEGRDKDDAEDSREESGSNSSPPPANSEEKSLSLQEMC
jgi:hypothetical protein